MITSTIIITGTCIYTCVCLFCSHKDDWLLATGMLKNVTGGNPMLVTGSTNETLDIWEDVGVDYNSKVRLD